MDKNIGGLEVQKDTSSIIKTTNFKRVSKEIVDKCLTINSGLAVEATYFVAKTLDKLGLNGAISANILMPITPGKVLAGPAITVKNVPDRILSPTEGWKTRERSLMGEGYAYETAQAGDVLVIDCNGRSDVSSLGAKSFWKAKKSGIVGAIVDGGIIHVATMRKLDYPVWTRGFTNLTGHHRVDTIAINAPVTCAGILINPGDLVVADDSGVVVVPRERAQEVVDLAKKNSDLWAETFKAEREGRSKSEVERLESALKAVGRNHKIIARAPQGNLDPRTNW
jgi:regulator of RNase E activity RraA